MSQVAQGSDNRVEMSQNLRVTLQRAGTYATEQSHRFVTIEHVLLALNEDPEAELMLQACEIDQGRLHSDVSNYLGRLEDRLSPGEAAQPVLDTEAARIVNSAVIAAQKSRRSEVNGAIVLAAIIGDGQTPAAQMLLAQGLNFKAAIEALQTANSTAPEAPPLPHTRANAAAHQDQPTRAPITAANDDIRQPPASTAEDALAQARERIRATQEAVRSNLPLKPSKMRPVANGTDAAGGSDQVPAPSPQREQDSPQPLQTEDSLARFERRAPPQIQATDQEAPKPDSSGGRSEIADQNGNQPALPPQVPESKPRPPEPVLDALEEITEPPAPAPPPVPASAPPKSRSGNPGSPVPSQLRRPDPQQFERTQPPHAQPYPRQPAPGAHPQPALTNAEGIRRPPPPSEQAPAYRPPPQYNPQVPPAPHGATPPGGPPPPADRRAFERAPAQQPPSNLPVPVEPPVSQASGAPIHPGQLVENIPRRMTKGVAQIVEVRVARADLSNLADGMQGQGLAQRHELVITQAMSLRLRAPNGGFFIETSSPETQWIENKLGLLSDDFASWRWTVTPQRTGRESLQLIVAARTVGGDGLMAETALPDQVFEVRISTNYKSLALRWTGWAAAAVIGGLFAKFGEQILTLGRAFLNT
ncbi:MAG: Clp protease N-terminal domain-containing protein [Pseudomonadota bacterium]